MLGVVLMLAQAIQPTAPPLPSMGPVLPPTLKVASRCNPSDDEIVVCDKKDPDLYRLRPLGPPPNGQPLPPMTAKLGKGTIDGRAVKHCVADICAPAAMATIKLPF